MLPFSMGLYCMDSISVFGKQPIVAPNDIKRYFVTPKESGELCLMSCIFGENRDIFFPKLSENLHLISFADIAVKYLSEIGYEPYLCESEQEARDNVDALIAQKKWPCLFTSSDTTGEKDFEEFFTDNEVLDMERFENLGVIKNEANFEQSKLESFSSKIAHMKTNKKWSKEEIVALFHDMIPNFGHKETGKYLDSKNVIMADFNSVISFIKSQYKTENFIPLHVPHFGGNGKYLLQTIDSTFVSSVGAYVDQFELMMQGITQTQKAVAVVNGTAGIQVALRLVGVKAGDEVLTQALTFVATANAIAYQNATPIFLDVDLDTMGLSPKAVSVFLEEFGDLRTDGCYNKKTGKKISACVPMHTFGFPVHLDELITVCEA